MSDFEYYLFLGGFFGIFIVIGILGLIKSPGKIATSTFEEASREVKEGRHRWIQTLLVLVVANVILWFWLGHAVPLRIFLAVLLGLDLMTGVFALGEFQTSHLSKKRVEELERLHSHEGGEVSSTEKE